MRYFSKHRHPGLIQFTEESMIDCRGMEHCASCAVIDPIVSISLFLELDPRRATFCKYVIPERRSLGQKSRT